MRSVFKALEERGFIAQASGEHLAEFLATQSVAVYAGFDPTADSLHLGHAVPIMALAHFQRAGHRVLLIVGGATGMVGDPSGRSEERNLLTPDQVARNTQCIKKQMERFFDFDAPNPPVLLNNDDWISKLSFTDWLREVGKFFSVNSMLAKDSIKRRLESPQGITYTEFSYMTMQAYDFLHLFDHFGCTLQCGGSDQWGNITAGIDLIRKLRQAPAYGLTFPLTTTSSGEKFGKSAGNAIWLDPKRTLPWDFYQYLVRQDDQDVIRFLKLYTFVSLERIAELEHATKTTPERREAQKALAFEVSRLVHGENTALELAHAADTVYGSEIKGISDETLGAVFSSVPSTDMSRAELNAGVELTSLLVRIGLTQSKGQSRRLLKSGGIYLNNVRVDDDLQVNLSNLASPTFIVLRSGKKNYHLIRVT